MARWAPDSARVGGRAAYVDYVIPAIILIAIAGAAQGPRSRSRWTCTGDHRPVPHDGDRPRLGAGGHVLGSTIQTMAGLAVVFGVAVAVGFRPTPTRPSGSPRPASSLMITLAITWLSVALGLAPKSVEAASNLPMPLILFPFLSSGFVPAESMPTGIRWFAEYQPFTPFIETLRGLLMGTPIGRSALLGVGWCALIGLVGFRWAMKLYKRDLSHA